MYIVRDLVAFAALSTFFVSATYWADFAVQVAQ